MAGSLMMWYCGACGTPLQRLGSRPPPGSSPGYWMHAGPLDDPMRAALKAHAAIVHDEMDTLPNLTTKPPHQRKRTT